MHCAPLYMYVDGVEVDVVGQKEFSQRITLVKTATVFQGGPPTSNFVCLSRVFCNQQVNYVEYDIFFINQ